MPPQPSKPDAEAIGERWSDLILSADPDSFEKALDMTAPDSPARLYARTVVLAHTPGTSGVSAVGEAPTIDEVSVDGRGRVVDTLRNGVPLSKIIKEGDGKVFTVTPGEYDDYTGKSVVKVVAFRLFDGYLQMMVEFDNRTSKAADVSLSNYVAGGVQYDIFVSASAEPSVKRVVVLGGEVGGAKKLPAGKIKARINNTEVEIAAPSLG